MYQVRCQKPVVLQKCDLKLGALSQHINSLNKVSLSESNNLHFCQSPAICIIKYQVFSDALKLFATLFIFAPLTPTHRLVLIKLIHLILFCI